MIPSRRTLPYAARRRLGISVAAAAMFATSAVAQMQLPGAVAPAGEGTIATPGPPKPKRTGPPPAPKVPSDDNLLGRTLELNGRTGVLQFVRDGKDFKLAKIVLPGEKISRPAETCTVDAPATPLALTPAGRPNGVTHYSAAVPDCAIDFDVLEGAVLVSPRPQACEFASADCRVNPTGLWGQPANEIGAARTKEIERARGPTEQGMRNYFRAWVETAGAGKDRELVRKVSRFQASFSSNRAEICDRYARESEHGYCSLILTQAHASALAARIPLPDAPPPEPDPGRRGKKR